MTSAEAARPVKISVTDIVAGGWLAVSIAGQLAFFAYIAVFYGAPLLSGSIESWNNNVLLARPPVEAGAIANTMAFGTHAFGAGIIAVLGGLQLLPFVRNRFRKFHRWNGRLFVTLVIALSISGYYLTWVRGPQPASFNEFATSVNGVLILSFAVLAVSAAMRKRFQVHERWAVRLFLVSSAQWFLRIGGFGYYAIAQSLGAEVQFDGWFFQFWMWGCFLVPLAVAQIYFQTRASRRASVRWSGAGLLAVCVPLTLVGSIVFTLFSIQLIQGNV
jgi:uncharacterized membrane protein